MADIFIESGADSVKEELNNKGFNHLKVRVYGKSIIIYSEYEGAKESRCRFTRESNNKYILAMANHKGKWEETPFEGTIKELLEIVLTQFAWILTDYSE
ncbi:MAG TPA: hypothetical protein VK426_02025 [Methanobacterium sp.]|nr:hypothetical protein [Methanobacterium sp.]